MTRRAARRGAAELFRSTDPAPRSQDRAAAADDRPTSGRHTHDAKITVYVSDEELLALEHARLAMRGVRGLAVDRGRIVREAIAVPLADVDTHGADSPLVRRPRQEPGG